MGFILIKAKDHKANGILEGETINLKEKEEEKREVREKGKQPHIEDDLESIFKKIKKRKKEYKLKT